MKKQSEVHANEATQFNLLIIDDEEGVRYMLAEYFEGLGVRCRQAHDGLMALEILQDSSEPVHAIICDINMPRMNGLSFLQQIRESGYDTPLIFLTANGDRNNIILALKGGAFDFLDKPIDLSLLGQSVLLALETGRRLIELSTTEHVDRAENREKEKAIHRQLLIMKSYRSREKKIV